MKKFLVSAALGVVLASPAFAQSYSAGYGTGNVINQPALEHGGFAAAPSEDAYAYQPSCATHACPRRVHLADRPRYRLRVGGICRARSGSECPARTPPRLDA